MSEIGGEISRREAGDMILRLAEIIRDMEDELAALRSQVAELQALTGDSVEYYCEKCNCLHLPTPGKILQLCPECNSMMTPTSYNLRKIAELQSQLDEAAKQKQVGELSNKNILIDGKMYAVAYVDVNLPDRSKLYAKPINLPDLIEQARAEAIKPYERVFKLLESGALREAQGVAAAIWARKP